MLSHGQRSARSDAANADSPLDTNRDAPAAAATAEHDAALAPRAPKQRRVLREARCEAVSLHEHTAILKLHYSGGSLVLIYRSVADDTYRRQLFWPLRQIARMHVANATSDGQALVTFDLAAPPRVEEWVPRRNPARNKPSGGWCVCVTVGRAAPSPSSARMSARAV